MKIILTILRAIFTTLIAIILANITIYSIGRVKGFYSELFSRSRFRASQTGGYYLRLLLLGLYGILRI